MGVFIDSDSTRLGIGMRQRAAGEETAIDRVGRTNLPIMVDPMPVIWQLGA